MNSKKLLSKIGSQLREMFFLAIANSLPRIRWFDSNRYLIIRLAGAKVDGFCEIWSPISIRPIGSIGNLNLGERVFINAGIHFGCEAEIRIGNDVLIAPRVAMETSFHPVDPESLMHRPLRRSPIIVEDNVWIGVGAVILPGVTIGRGSVVAAGAVVTKSVPPFVLVAGVPARTVRPIRICNELKGTSISDLSIQETDKPSG